jgi:Spy/CpxP family protein refolding chaperone
MKRFIIALALASVMSAPAFAASTGSAPHHRYEQQNQGASQPLASTNGEGGSFGE